MLSRAFSRSIFAKPLEKVQRLNLLKRNYKAPPGRRKFQFRDYREFTPKDERVRSFPIVAFLAGVLTCVMIGNTAHFVYMFPNTIKLKEESADANFTWATADFPLTLANQVEKPYLSLSVLEKYSEEKVHEKATDQLTIAVNELMQINNEINSGKRDRNDTGTQEEIKDILATVCNLESILAKFAHISKSNVDYMIDNNILRNIAYLQDNPNDQMLVMLRNGKLLYAIDQYPEYQALAKLSDHFLPMAPASEAFLATPEIPLLAPDINYTIKEMGPKVVSIALFGAAYCSLAWKLLHPRIPKGILVKKAMWAAVGCVASPVIGVCYAQFAQSKTALQAISDNISGKSKHPLYSSDSLFVMESITDIIGVLSTIIPLYYGRFLLFPALFGQTIYESITKFFNDPKNTN